MRRGNKGDIAIRYGAKNAIDIALEYVRVHNMRWQQQQIKKTSHMV